MSYVKTPAPFFMGEIFLYNRMLVNSIEINYYAIHKSKYCVTGIFPCYIYIKHKAADDFKHLRMCTNIHMCKCIDSRLSESNCSLNGSA